MSKTYRGIRVRHDCTVTVHRPAKPGVLLPLRLDLFNHSPCGFNWGYQGSGPAQLALALLCDAIRDDDLAVSLHQDFKRELIAPITENEWMLTEQEIVRWVAAKAVDLPPDYPVAWE